MSTPSRLRALAGTDETAPLVIPGPLLALAQVHQRQIEALTERRNELVSVGLALLGISPETKANVDIATGLVTVTPVVENGQEATP